jgi:hypothetical protein
MSLLSTEEPLVSAENQPVDPLPLLLCGTVRNHPLQPPLLVLLCLQTLLLDDVLLLSPILPGYREAEEKDSKLSETLDSLLPSLSDIRFPQPLPIFLGKKAIDSTVEIGSSSSQLSGKGGKAFAWSRGLASELSPVKTRSSQKKLASSSHKADESIPTSLDSGALRAMKALARAK